MNLGDRLRREGQGSVREGAALRLEKGRILLLRYVEQAIKVFKLVLRSSWGRKVTFYLAEKTFGPHMCNSCTNDGGPISEEQQDFTNIVAYLFACYSFTSTSRSLLPRHHSIHSRDRTA